MIRTYYLADVWLRVSVVLFAVALWIFAGTRFGTAELVYVALIVVILFGANQMYKSGNLELLLAALRPAGTSAGERS